MRRVHKYEENGYYDRKESEDRGEEETQSMEGNAMPYRLFVHYNPYQPVTFSISCCKHFIPTSNSAVVLH